MADGIALLDKFKTNTRYFIVHEIVMAASVEHGNIISVPKDVGLLDLHTRTIMLIPIAVLLKEIEDGKLWRWHVDYSLFKPQPKKDA